MSGTKSALQAHYDTPIHNTRIGKDGIVEGHAIETHYVIAEGIALNKGENWLSVIIDYQDIQLETRLPLDQLIKFLASNIPPAEAKNDPVAEMALRITDMVGTHPDPF